MPGIKDLRKRIVSVRNTKQTTKAMKMVSASKLRRAQESIWSNRPYSKQIGELIRIIQALDSAEFHPPVVEGTENIPTRLLEGGETEAGRKRKLLLVLVTSDRGLCGGFNSNVIRLTSRWLNENSSNYESVKLAFVGRRGNDFFKTRQVNRGPYFAEQGGKVTYAKAKQVAEGILSLYTSGEVDEVKFIYNEFKNAISQRTLVEDFLPLNDTLADGSAAKASKPVIPEGRVYLVKPSPREMLVKLLIKNFAIQCYRIMLESQAGEHGARMSAMDSATKNADEMTRKLLLQYNKQRQAGITKELLEIVAGSESQKN